MANVEINDIAAKVNPVSTDELEIQGTGGGTSNKTTIANFIKALLYKTVSAKAAPVAADAVPIADSAASDAPKYTTFANLSKGLTYDGLTAKATPIAADLITISDTAASNVSKKVTLGSLITGQATVTAASGDLVLIIDATDGSLKNADADDFAGAGDVLADGTVSMTGSLNFDNTFGVTIDDAGGTPANAISLDGSDELFIGDATSIDNMTFDLSNAFGSYSFDFNGSTQATIGATGTVTGGQLGSSNTATLGASFGSLFYNNRLKIGYAAGDYTIQQENFTADTATTNINIIAQAALAAASTNITGGDVNITGGAGASGAGGDAHGGDIVLTTGQGYGTGDPGIVIIDTSSTPASNQKLFSVRKETVEVFGVDEDGDIFMTPDSGGLANIVSNAARMKFNLVGDLTEGIPVQYEFANTAASELRGSGSRQATVKINADVHQTGTASYDALYINSAEATLGDGSTGDGNNLLNLAVGGASLMRVVNDGNISLNNTLGLDILDAAGTAANAISLDGSDDLYIGDATSVDNMVFDVASSGTWSFDVNGTPVSTISATGGLTANLWLTSPFFSTTTTRTQTTGANESRYYADRLFIGSNLEYTIEPTTRVGDGAAVDVNLIGGAALAAASTNLDGGDVNITGGAGASGSAGDADGGNVSIDGGQEYGTGDVGNIIMASLPTSDPGVAGALWNNSNVMNISTG